MRSGLVRIAIAVVALGALVSACAGGSNDRPTIGAVTEPSAGAPTTTAPPYISYVAQPLGARVQVREAPDVSSASQELPNPWLLNDDPELTVPQVFLVEERKPGWVRVHLPVRPNGTTGWIRTSEVRLTPNRYRILIELGAHQITVYNGDEIVIQEPAAVGKESTPTPTGKFYLRVLLKAPDPNTVYGPYAYGLSGHSEVLTEFNGGDAELGIHGNNDPTVLGQSVTAGCTRIGNETITKLAGMLPLGTPVEIVA